MALTNVQFLGLTSQNIQQKNIQKAPINYENYHQSNAGMLSTLPTKIGISTT